MDRREQSREEWERELIEGQYNVLPADGSRVGHILAKKSSSPGPIPDAAHLIRGISGGAVLVAALEILRFAHRAWLGIAALAAGICLLVSSVRWKSKRDQT